MLQRADVSPLSVFFVFRFCCSSRKAVFDLGDREWKFTYILWQTNLKRMGVTHEQQKRVRGFCFGNNHSSFGGAGRGLL